MVEIKDRYQSIAIIGFMATGKTTIAKELSQRLNLEFVDIDKLIEKEEKVSISEIFETHGEEYFRELERKAIKKLNSLKGLIVSCGGGVCLNPENVVNLKNNYKVVLLKAKAQTVIKRTQNDKSRPLLNGKNSIEAVKKIMDERYDSYQDAADIIIVTDYRSKESICNEIIEKLKL